MLTANGPPQPETGLHKFIKHPVPYQCRVLKLGWRGEKFRGDSVFLIQPIFQMVHPVCSMVILLQKQQ
jgi:hypothetical protein